MFISFHSTFPNIHYNILFLIFNIILKIVFYFIISVVQLSIQKRYTSHPSHIPVSHCSGDSGDMLMCSTAGDLELYSDLSSNIGDNLQTTLRTLPMSHNHEIGQLTAVNDDLLISISRFAVCLGFRYKS